MFDTPVVGLALEKGLCARKSRTTRVTINLLSTIHNTVGTSQVEECSASHSPCPEFSEGCLRILI